MPLEFHWIRMGWEGIRGQHCDMRGNITTTSCERKGTQGYSGSSTIQHGIWVDNQRTASENKKMTEERKRLLNSIGFVWDRKAPGTSVATWEEMYQRLVMYTKKHHGDTKVPQKLKKILNLDVASIFDALLTGKINKMTEEHKCLLNSFGFYLVVFDAIRIAIIIAAA